ncbi:MAG TPA: DUF6636 domain-containing protein [Solirubrobacteraceae bacterium]|jgi:hypothetical protein
MTRALTLALAALLVVPATAAAKDPEQWNSPSGNIRCGSFSRQLLRCDMTELGNPRAPRPESCEFDYGNTFGIRGNGRRGFRMCVSDAIAGPDYPTLKYGTVWRRNGFRCTIRRSGVRCTNRRGHGFSLRRGRQRVF